MRSNLAVDIIKPVSIGNTIQWVSIRGKDLEAPVILFLHGGPGTAQIMFARKSQRALDEEFIVVNWDQRGAGRSYSKKLSRDDMTIDQFVDDAEELIEFLLKKLNKKKLFLVGHSWGSIIGLKIARRRPDLIYAYVGIGQVVNMSRGEEISYQFTLDEAVRRQNWKAVKQLKEIGHPPYRDLAAAGIQRDWLSKFNGATYRGSGLATLLANTSLRDTNLKEMIKFVQGILFSLACLEEEQMKVDFTAEIASLDVPVYFCCGRRDYNVPFALTVEYAQNLVAPQVEVVWFEQSAHLANFEEPEAFAKFCLRMKNEIKEAQVSEDLVEAQSLIDGLEPSDAEETQVTVTQARLGSSTPTIE